jgi:hypothetical protein
MKVLLYTVFKELATAGFSPPAKNAEREQTMAYQEPSFPQS